MVRQENDLVPGTWGNRYTVLVKCPFLMAAVLAAGLAQTAQAKQDTLVIGLISRQSLGRSEFAQVVHLMQTVAATFEQRTGVPVRVDQYRTEQEFDEAILAGVPDVLVNSSGLAQRNGYKPFLVYALFDLRRPRDCLFVPKSFEGTVEDLRGQRGQTLQEGGKRYWRFHKFLGEDPATYFDRLEAAANDGSMVYALALEQTDAAWVDDRNYRYQLAANPGPAKKVKPLGCVEDCPPYMLINGKTDPALVKEIRHMLVNLMKIKETRPHRALFKTIGLSFSPYSEEDRQLCDTLAAEHHQEWGHGPAEEYERWRVYNVKNALP